ncbi:hypothetical protein [Hymenobacter daeguensis]
MTRIRRFLQWLGPLMPYCNMVLAGAAYWANEYWFQGFCQPVEWAAWVLVVSTAAFLLWPFAKRVPVLNYVLLFLMGVHFTVCVYCALFIGLGQMMQAVVLFFLILPLLLWVPVLFAAQVLDRAASSALPGSSVVFMAGVLALVPVQLWAERQYREIEAAVASLPTSQRHQAAALIRVVPRNYVAERLAGALFKYHNYPEFIFDGWRPPLHDPLVNVSLWSRSGMNYSKAGAREANPLLVGLIDSQAVFYHQLFPQLPVKADCTCNHTDDGESYRKWIPNRGRRMPL